MKSASEVARCFSCGSPDHISSQCPRGRLCMNCESPSHLAQDCPHPDRGRDIRTCYNCGSKGHLAKNCPASSSSSGSSATPPSTSSLTNNSTRFHGYSQQYPLQHPMQQQQGAFQRQYAWQQGVATNRGSKFRSASVNSTSSYESFYSGFGNHNETDCELSSFESPSFTSPMNQNHMTPPTKREQPSPFQPIYAGFGTPFAYEEKGLNGFQGHQEQQQYANHHGISIDLPSGLSAEDVENKFEPVAPAQRALFDTRVVTSKLNGNDGFLYSGPPSNEMNFGMLTPSPARETSVVLEPRPASQPLPLTTHMAGTSVAMTSVEEIDADKDKKKKRKKKKKKKGQDAEDGENSAENQDSMRCFNCDGIGHLSRDCKAPRACFLCGETTHVAKQCKFSALSQEVLQDESTLSVAATTKETSTISKAVEEPSQAAPTGDEQRGDVSGEGEKKKNICLNCSEPGHRLKNCPYGRKCFQCGKVGHVARECPNISEAMKMLQKRRMEENPSPESVTSDTFVAGSSGLPSRMSTASSSTAFSSSMQGGSFYSSSSSSMNHPGSSAVSTTPSGMAPRYGAISPFMVSSSNNSCSPSPSSVRPNSCSPPLIFGHGAFSSFSAVDMNRDVSSAEAIAPAQEEDSDPTQEVDDPQLQDFVSNLLTDLDLNEEK